MIVPPKSIVKDIYSFLKWPDRQIQRSSLDVETFLRLLGVHYLFLLFAIIILSLGTFLFGIDQLDHSIEDLISESSPFAFLFLLAVAAPLLEELFFRFPLRFRRGALFIVLTILAIFVYLFSATVLPANHHFIPQESLGQLANTSFVPNMSAVILAGIVFILGLSVIFLMSISESTLNTLGKIIDRLYPYIFFASAMIFGYVHFTNFTGEMKWFWIPFLIVPQFMMGLVMGYARLRFGMLSNILLHAVNNLIPGLVMLTTLIGD